MASEQLRLERGISRGAAFQISVNAESCTAYPGETLSTVLLAAGRRTFRLSQKSKEPRGMYCGMGICFDCLVTINGQPNIRACVTLAHPGDVVEIEHDR